MKDFTFDENQILLIKSLLNFSSVEIIWDIDVFYFNTESDSFKLECFDEIPEGSDYKYDEIFYCTFKHLSERIIFEANNSKYWYKIICTDCKLIDIKYINIVQSFPDDTVVPNDFESTDKNGLNRLTVGLIVHTDKGFLPAFLLPSNHGFMWPPKYDFYLKPEIDDILEREIKFYEINNCA